jgi:hypothetical protein
MTNIIANEDLREIKRLISAGKITLSELMERLAPSTEIAGTGRRAARQERPQAGRRQGRPRGHRRP